MIIDITMVHIHIMIRMLVQKFLLVKKVFGMKEKHSMR